MFKAPLICDSLHLPFPKLNVLQARDLRLSFRAQCLLTFFAVDITTDADLFEYRAVKDELF